MQHVANRAIGGGPPYFRPISIPFEASAVEIAGVMEEIQASAEGP
jgi:hypothetical protein